MDFGEEKKPWGHTPITYPLIPNSMQAACKCNALYQMCIAVGMSSWEIKPLVVGFRSHLDAVGANIQLNHRSASQYARPSNIVSSDDQCLGLL
ncbi:hypothetical protein BaRGS_00037606 [Batillaria attramentaria]|uniref:Piwi domain-containing protein n=1 Tax=Batillaria attramentaria TaxID=370345 RepID=A0ABD0J8P3_9CAEN